jgi:hypothetical protein
MTPKQLAEYWSAESALAAMAGHPQKHPWWKRAYIWIVFKISPPRLPEDSN